MTALSVSLTRVLGPPESRAKRSVGAAVVVVILAILSFGLDINLLTVLVAAMQNGVVYALVAVGIALVYKSTRVLNFAQGEIGTVAAFFVFMGLAGFDSDVILEASYPLLTMVGWSVLAMLIGAVVAIAINLGVVSRLSNAAPVTTLVATIGVALLLAGTQVLAFEPLPRPYPVFAAGAPPGFGADEMLVIGGANITYQFIFTTIVLILVSVALATFFRTPIGGALLATSQEPFAAQLHGVSLRAMSTLAWGTAGAFGGLAGVLAGGAGGTIFPGFMTSKVLIPAIVASVLGGITSVPGAVGGALILALVQSIATAAVISQGWQIPGPAEMATFAVLLAVLLFRPRGLFGKEA